MFSLSIKVYKKFLTYLVVFVITLIISIYTVYASWNMFGIIKEPNVIEFYFFMYLSSIVAGLIIGIFIGDHNTKIIGSFIVGFLNGIPYFIEYYRMSKINGLQKYGVTYLDYDIQLSFSFALMAMLCCIGVIKVKSWYLSKNDNKIRAP